MGILIVSLSLAAKVPTTLWVWFLSPQKKIYHFDYEVFCLCFLKKNRNKKVSGSATLSKIVLLWGFHLLDVFL